MEDLKLTDFGKLVDEATSPAAAGPMLHFEPFDDKVGGMNRRLVVVAGYSGSYKTTYALNMAYNNAIKLGWTSVFLSLEMDEKDLLKKLLLLHAAHPKFSRYSIAVKVPNNNWSCLSIDEREFLKNVVGPDLNNGLDEIGLPYGNIFLLSAKHLAWANYDIEKLLEEVENTCLANPSMEGKYFGIEILLVDYIQLLAGIVPARNSMETNRFQKVGDIIRYLQRLTQTYVNCNGRGIVIVALSQINREGFKYVRDSKGENFYDLTSLADSNEIGVAADIVIALRQDDEDRKGYQVKAAIIKNRFGETTETHKMLCLPEHSYIGDYRRASQEEMDNIVDALLSR